MSNLEVEFKYPAEDINFVNFHEFCSKNKPTKTLVVCGYDHFYSKGKNNKTFCRHRIDNTTKEEELAYKEKTSRHNTYVRTEINLPVSPKKDQDVKQFFESLGYKYNSTIFKSSYIYIFNDHIASYYIVYDERMKEIGRFVEIEVDESPTHQNLEYLKKVEKRYKDIGLVPKKRSNKSLFEMYRKA